MACSLPETTTEAGLLTTDIEGTGDDTCGLYLIGELNSRVIVDFMQFETRCYEGSIVAVRSREMSCDLPRNANAILTLYTIMLFYQF